MKKIVSIILSVSILMCALTVFASAAKPDVCFTMSGSTGSTGDTVTVDVIMTENPGLWSAYFFVNFDSSVLKLKDVSNGNVFSNGDFIKSKLDFDGYYIYYAQIDSFGQSNYNTGLILTLTFEIAEDAPVGTTPVYLTFPDKGLGWFFSGEDPSIDYTVPDDGAVCTSVTVKEKGFILGDIDNSGKVTLADCVYMKKLVLGSIGITDWYMKTADINGDTKINIADTNLLIRIILGSEVD